MTTLGRTFSCMVSAAAFGFVGLILAAIFAPLAFPLSLCDSSHAENAAFVLMLIVVLVFAISGVVLCWKITSRWVRSPHPSTVLKIIVAAAGEAPY